jgi:hypothetical protein
MRKTFVPISLLLAACGAPPGPTLNLDGCKILEPPIIEARQGNRVSMRVGGAPAAVQTIYYYPSDRANQTRCRGDAPCYARNVTRTDDIYAFDLNFEYSDPLVRWDVYAGTLDRLGYVWGCSDSFTLARPR